MDLAIPIYYKGGVYVGAETKKPSGKVLADMQESFASQTPFHGILELINGCVTAYRKADDSLVNDKNEMMLVSRFMPYRAAEDLGLQIMASINEDDVITAKFQCPRCGDEHFPIQDGTVDDRPRVSDLEVTKMSPVPQEETLIIAKLEDPISIVGTKGEIVVDPFTQMSMHFPTLDDCINGALRVKGNKDMRRQYAIYASAIESIDGRQVDSTWRAQWGAMIFERMSVNDLRDVGKRVREFGVSTTVERTCPKCGAGFQGPVDTSNFFVSGLQIA